MLFSHNAVHHLLAIGGLAVLVTAIPPAIESSLRLSASVRIAAQHAASPLDISSNVIALTRRPSYQGSSLALHALRTSSKGSIARRGATTSDILSVHDVDYGTTYYGPVTVGGQTFNMVLDTGSSDTWLIKSSFQCFNATTGQNLTQAACKFGPASYSTSYTSSSVQDRYMSLQYADKEQVSGPLSLDNMAFAGVQIKRQEFGVVDRAAWSGDGTTSGLVGLAYMDLTHAQDSQDNGNYPYSPIMQSLFAQNNIPAMFSVALQRDDGPGAPPPSYLALGGLPDIAHDPTFYNTTIDTTIISATSTDFVYYTIDVDGYAISSDHGAQFNTQSSTNAYKTPLIYKGTQSIIDTGSTFCAVPPEVCDALVAGFEPAGRYDDASGFYTVPCNAKIPLFGISIANKVFYLNSADIVAESLDGSTCILGVQSNGGGINVLGDTFLHNVLAVFDLGNAEMRFAARF